MTEKMKIKLRFNDIDVEVELSAGINMLSGDSGTGKTLLMQAVELYCAENKIKYTFLNYRNRDNSIEQLLTLCDKSEVIIIDNADLFISEKLVSKLKEKSKYLLISLKDSTKIDERDIIEYIVHYKAMLLRLEEI